MRVSLEKPGTPEELVHLGIKGMKWGVRKNKDTKSPLIGLVQKPIIAKTKNGDTFTLTERPPSKLSKGLAKISKRFETHYRNSSNLDIKDKNGKTIGNFQLIKKNKDELNLAWVSVDKSSRGQGYAAAVTKEAIKYAKKNGMKKVTLEAIGNSPGGSAPHLAKQMGFKVIKEPTAAEIKNDPVWGGLTEMEYKIK